MRYAFALVVFSISGAALAQAPASSNDEVSRALGGNSWLPPSARPRSPADPANTGGQGQQADIPAAASSEAADAIPTHDVDAACEAFADRVPKTGLATRNGSLRVCLEEEQEGYDASHALWSEITAQHRQECLRHAGSFTAENYYRALGGCIQGKFAMESAHREMTEKPPRFQY